MSAVAIRLPDTVPKRLNSLAMRTGRSKTFYMLEAICEHLDEIEDRYLAEKRMIELQSGKSRTYTLKEVEQELDLAD